MSSIKIKPSILCDQCSSAGPGVKLPSKILYLICAQNDKKVVAELVRTVAPELAQQRMVVEGGAMKVRKIAVAGVKLPGVEIKIGEHRLKVWPPESATKIQARAAAIGEMIFNDLVKLRQATQLKKVLKD
jgi:hypothetical protein